MLRKYLSVVEKNQQSSGGRSTVGRSISMAHLRPFNEEQGEILAAYNFLSSPSAQYEDEQTINSYIDDLVSNNRLVSGFNYAVELFVWLSERQNHNGLLSSVAIRKSIVSLVRRMRRECSSIKNILIALITNGQVSHSCCVINKTQDGRLQVDGCKRFPHILSFQLFRSPYVRSKCDLNSISQCQHPFHSDDHLVCLNPYHYVLTPIFIQKSLMANFYTFIDSRLILEASAEEHPQQSFSEVNYTDAVVPHPTNASNFIYNPPVNPFEQNSTYVENLSLSSHHSVANAPYLCSSVYRSEAVSPDFFPFQMGYNDMYTNSNTPFLPTEEETISLEPAVNNAVNDGFEEIRNKLKHLMTNDQSKECTSTRDNDDRTPVHVVENGKNCGIFTVKSNQHIRPNNLIISMDGKYIVTKNKSKYMSGSLIADSYMFHSDDTSTDRYSAESSTLDFQPIGECGPHNSWCSIIYHEYNKQVGDVTHVPRSIRDAFVDGYTNVSTIKKNSFRLSIAQLSTSSNRDDTVNRCISNIGKGIRVKRRSDGSISIRCLGESSVFIHSYFMDVESKSPVGGAVHKVLTDVSVHVFIWEYFVRETEQLFSVLDQMIHNYIYNGSNDSNYRRSQLNEILCKFKSTIETLHNRCIISLSFVKGWGYNYSRNVVSSTPCWIELYANDAIAFLEDISGRFWTVIQDTCVVNTAAPLESYETTTRHPTNNF